MRQRRAQRIGMCVLRGTANDGLGYLPAVQVNIGGPGRDCPPHTLATRQGFASRTAVANGNAVAAGAPVQAVSGVARVSERGRIGAYYRASAAAQAPAAGAAVDRFCCVRNSPFNCGEAPAGRTRKR
jgi:hypothetical protein